MEPECSKGFWVQISSPWGRCKNCGYQIPFPREPASKVHGRAQHSEILLQSPNLQSRATNSQFVLLDSRKMCKRLAIRSQVLHPHIDLNDHGVLTRSGLTKATWDRATL